MARTQNVNVRVRLNADGSGLVGQTRLSKEEMRKLGREFDTTRDRGQRLNRTTSSMQTNFRRLAGLAGTLGVSLSAIQFGRMSEQAIRNAAALSEQADVAGVSAERLQEVQKSMADLGGVTETVTSGALRRFNRRLGLAADGGGAAKDTFGELDIAIRDAGEGMRSTESVLDDALERLAGIESESLRAARASELFGEDAGPQLAAVLAQGTDAINAHIEALREDGRILEDELAEQARAANDQMARMRDIVSTEFARVITDNAQSMTELAEAVGAVARTAVEGASAFARFAELVGMGVADIVHGNPVRELEGQIEGLDTQINLLIGRAEMLRNLMQQLEGRDLGERGQERLQGVREQFSDTREEIDLLREERQELIWTWEDLADLGGEPMEITVTGGQQAAEDMAAIATGAGDAADQTDDLADRFRRLRRQLDPTHAATQDYLQSVDLLDDAWARGLISGEQYDRLLTELATGSREAEESTRDLEAAADPMATAFEEAVRRIDGLFVDLWEDAFSGFDDFVDGVKSTFRRMLAEMAHAAITRPIMVSLGIAGGGLPGQASAAAQAGGNIPGIGGIGNLLGGGGIAGSLNQVFQGSATGPFQGAGGMGLFGGSNLGFGLAGLGGGLIGQQFGGAGGIGGSIGGAAGFGLASGGGAIGSALSGLGALAGPLGAIGGALLGGALGGLFGGEPDDAQFMFGAGGSGPPRLNDPGRSTELAGGLRIRQDRGGEMNESERRDIEGAVAQAIGPQVAAINEILVATTGDTIAENLDDATEIRKFVKRHIGDKGEIDNGATVVVDAIVEAIGGKFAERLEGFDRHQLGQVLGAFATVARVRSAGSVTGQARDARETQTATEAFRDQSDALRDLVREYDGSVQSTQELAAAFQRTNQSAVQLAAGLMGVSDRVDATLSNLSERIRQDLMGEEELYQHRRERIHDLVDDLSQMEDPQRIRGTIDQIEQRTAQLWQSLDQSQKEELGEGFLAFLDETNELAQERIGDALAGIDQEMNNLGGDVADKFGLSVSAFEAAAGQQSAAAAQMQSAASSMQSAAAAMQAAANTPTRVQVTQREPEVG